MIRVIFAPIIKSTTAAYSNRVCICGKQEVFSIKWCRDYDVWICVYSFFKASCDIYVLVCGSLDRFWYCVVMISGFFANSFFVLYCTFTFWCVIPLEQQILVWDSFTLKHGQLQTGEERFYKVYIGFRVVVAFGH
jgi:hypothetical protein